MATPSTSIAPPAGFVLDGTPPPPDGFEIDSQKSQSSEDVPQLKPFTPTIGQRISNAASSLRRSQPIESILGKTPEETAQMLEPRPTGLIPNVVKAAKEIPKVASVSPADVFPEQKTVLGGASKELLSQANLGNLAMLTGIGEVWKAANLAKDAPRIAALTKAMIGAYFSTQGAKGVGETAGQLAGTPDATPSEIGKGIAGIGINALMAFAPSGEAILSGKVKPFDRSKIPISGTALESRQPKGATPPEVAPNLGGGESTKTPEQQAITAEEIANRVSVMREHPILSQFQDEALQEIAKGRNPKEIENNINFLLKINQEIVYALNRGEEIDAAEAKYLTKEQLKGVENPDIPSESSIADNSVIENTQPAVVETPTIPPTTAASIPKSPPITGKVTAENIDSLTPEQQATLKHGDGIEYGLTLSQKEAGKSGTLQNKYDAAAKEMNQASKKGDDAAMKAAFGKLNFFGGALMGASRGKHPISGSNYTRFIEQHPELALKHAATLAEPTPPATTVPAKAETAAPVAMVGMGAAIPKEFEQSGSFVSNMFAAIDRDRAEMGKEPMPDTKRRTWDEDNQKALAMMNRDPDWIPSLIREVTDHPRPLLSWENSGMVWQRQKWKAEANNFMRELAQSYDDGRDADVAENKLRVSAYEDRLQELDDAVGRNGTGSEAGRSLQAQKMATGPDFSLIEMRLEKRAAVGGRPLTDAESSEIERLHGLIAETQKNFDDYIAKTESEKAEAAVKSALAEVERQARQQPVVEPHVRLVAEKLKSYFKTSADAALERIRARHNGTTSMFSGAPLHPEDFDDAVIFGASKMFEKGISGAEMAANWAQEMATMFGDGIKPMLQTIWAKANQSLDAGFKKIAGVGPASEKVKRAARQMDTGERRDIVTKQIGDKIAKGKRNEITNAVQRLARLFVQDGVKVRDELIEKVHAVLSGIDPTFTRRETMDSISGYGDFKQLSKDEISVQLRTLKGEMQQVAKLEDMQAGKPALKTGIERRAVGPEESKLIRQVNEAKRKFQIPISDPNTQLRSSLDELKKRMQTLTAELNEKLANGDFAPRAQREPIKLDAEALRLRAENMRAKQAYQKGLLLDRLKNRRWWEKTQDTWVKWRRGFLLSGPTTLAKLTSAAVQRMVFTPMEEVVGGVYSKVLPKLASKASREGGLSSKAEAKAFTQAVTKGMLDSWDVLKRGQSELDVLYGQGREGYVRESFVLPRSVIDIFGQIHGALKAPVKRAEFARSFEKRSAAAIHEGVDITDPLVQTRLATESFKDASRSIFLQDNIVSDRVSRFINSFSQKSKITGKTPIGGKIATTIGKTLLPITKVPTNIVGETFQYALGLPSGAARLALAMRRGVETLRPEEADLIMRHLKKGSVGGAVLLLGYLNPNTIGGYYQYGEKRKPGEVKAATIRVYGHDIPSFLLHNPLLETLQIGATIRRVADSKLRKRDAGTQGVPAGIVAGAMGLTEEVPFVREMMEVSKAFNPHERGAFFGELAKSFVVPQLAQWMATHQDRDVNGNPIQRKPQTIVQHIETGIPVLRKNVPTKGGATNSIQSTPHFAPFQLKPPP